MANAKAGGAIVPSVATGDPFIPEPFPMMGYSGSLVGDGEGIRKEVSGIDLRVVLRRHLITHLLVWV